MLCENQTPQQWNTPKNKRQKLHKDNAKTSSLSADQIPTIETLLTFQMLLGFPNNSGNSQKTQIEHPYNLESSSTWMNQELGLVTDEDLHARKGLSNLQRQLLEAEGCPWLLPVVTSALKVTSPAIYHKGELFLKPPQQIVTFLVILRIPSSSMNLIYSRFKIQFILCSYAPQLKDAESCYCYCYCYCSGISVGNTRAYTHIFTRFETEGPVKDLMKVIVLYSDNIMTKP